MVLQGLSFAPGLKIQADVSCHLGRPVSSPELDLHSFALVVAFGRCKFRLDLPSMSSIIQATIGGSARHFRVSLLSDRTFKFFVSSKQVGFYVANLQSFSCEMYSLNFHLWGNGGPNWRREFALYQEEECRSWKLVIKHHEAKADAPCVSVFHRLGKSFADVVRSAPAPPLSGANSVPIGASKQSSILGRCSVFNRLQPRSEGAFMVSWQANL